VNRIILFLALLFLNVQVFAGMNCAETFKKVWLEWQFDIPEDYAIDSIYDEMGSSEKKISTIKVFWTGTHMDSVASVSFQNDTSSYSLSADDYIQKVSKEGDLSVITVNKEGNLSRLVKYYDGKDSLYYNAYLVLASGEENEIETGYILIRKDTVFVNDTIVVEHSGEKYTNEFSLAFLQDPQNENRCVANNNNGSSNISLELKDGGILLSVSSASPDDAYNSQKFYLPVNGKEASGILRSRPTIRSKMIQFFDLKGRPVRGHVVGIPASPNVIPLQSAEAPSQKLKGL